MNTSATMRQMIEGWEGLRLSAYQDVVGVWTIGYGHTGGVVPGETITQAEADTFMSNDLHTFEVAVTDYVGSAPTSQGQFDAMVSFAYNLGSGALKNSTLLKKHNAGDFQGAADEFLKWNHAGGQVLAGLTRRREGERARYLDDTVTAASPTASTSTAAVANAAIPSAITMQTALQLAGFYKGALDGIFGPQSAAALVAYYASQPHA